MKGEEFLYKLLFISIWDVLETNIKYVYRNYSKNFTKFPLKRGNFLYTLQYLLAFHKSAILLRNENLKVSVLKRPFQNVDSKFRNTDKN